MSDLRRLFNPQAIALVGASASPDKAGYAMAQSLGTARARVDLVNSRGGEILGRAVYKRIGEIPHGVDLAVVTVPPPSVPAVLSECVEYGVPAAVICAGGFAESGPEGERLQAEVADIVGTSGLRVLGPNTSGFMNPGAGVCANFMPAVSELEPGPIAVVAQSGGVNLALSFMLAEAGIGISLGVGLGNAVDVSTADVLEYLAADDDTRAIALHIEGIDAGRELMDTIRRVSALKPIVTFKVGRNDIGEFAKSHTGALTGSYRTTRQALRQSGAVVVDSPTELVDAVRALSAVRLAPNPDPGVAIVTGQAGPGLIIADALASKNVSVPPLGAETVSTLSRLLPPITFQRNPVDTGRPGATFAEVLAVTGEDASVNLLCVYALDEPGALDPSAALRSTSTPAVFGTGGTVRQLEEREKDLRGTPFYRSPDRLANGVAALALDSQSQFSARDKPESPPTLASLDLPLDLDEDTTKAYFARLGLQLPNRQVAATHHEAHLALTRIGGPAVVKVLDASILHKSDVGGVHVNVRTAADLDAALAAIDLIPGQHRYLIEAQASPGVELIVGGRRDASFGPLVVCGVGGVDVELGPDPVLRLAPFSRAEAMRAVAELPRPILEGHRGAPPVDPSQLTDILLAVSTALVDNPEIAEIDLNPVRSSGEGLVLLDALIIRFENPSSEASDRRRWQRGSTSEHL